jgi:aminomethyltransferase
VSDTADASPLRRTPLYDLHVALGARMVAFAGYAMPVQYTAGIIAEHRHTRVKAGLFDVSHMGQLRLRGDAAADALETLVPGDLRALAPGQMRYTLLLNDAGGVLDDLMVTRVAGGLALVVNAACKDADLRHLQAHLPRGVDLEPCFERALLALQGPQAAAVLARHAAGVERMSFMTGVELAVAGIQCFVTRSGYTGEDGFELSVAPGQAPSLAERLLAEPEVAPVGLGARDTLRLEAGLCLYGHDIDAATTPVEAALAWTIGRRRRIEGGFPGCAAILKQIAEGPSRRRVGIRPDGRAPAREGTAITDAAGMPLGQVTSGGFGPSLGAPIAMGYVAANQAAPGTQLQLIVRDVPRLAQVVSLPFVPTRYYRG